MTQDPLRDYINQERAKGVSDEGLRTELANKGWDPIAVHRAIGGLEVTPTAPKLSLNKQTITLLVGLGLIFVGAFGFLGYSWPELSPLGRFLMIAIPNLCLFLTGHLLAKGEQLETTKELTYTTAGLLLPVTIGTFLYQFAFYQNFDGLLIAYSLLIALPLYLYAAWQRQHSHAFLLMALASMGIAIGLFSDSQLDGWRSSALTILVAVLALASAWKAKNQAGERYFSALFSVGTALLVIGWPTLIGDALPLAGIQGDFALILSALLSTGGLLLGALVVGHHFTPLTRAELFHQRLLVIAAALTGFSAVLSGDSQATLSLVGVLIGTTFVIIGLEARVAMIKWFGFVGGALSVLSLVLSSIDHELVVIMMFVAGFAAVFGSIIMTKRGASPLADKVAVGTQWKSGLISDADAHNLPIKTGEAPTFITVVIRIALVFMLWLLMQFLIFGIGPNYSGTPNINEGDYHYRAPNSFI